MAAATTIHVLTNGGYKLAVLDDFISLEYGLLVNAPSPLTLELSADAIPWSWLNRDVRLEVWRRAAGGRQILMGSAPFLLRRRRRFTDAQGRRRIQIGAERAIGILGRRIVDYVAGSSQASKTAAADNMIKAIVRENLGSLASDTTRDLSRWLSVASDLGAAPSLSKAYAYRNVLQVCQEIADASATAGTRLYFDVVRTADDTLELRTYTGQRGDDHTRSGPVVVTLSPATDSLQEPSIEETFEGEITRTIAGGQGIKDQRTIQRADDTTRQGASPFGLIESFAQATMAESSGAVLAAAQGRLREARPRRIVTGTISDSPGARFGRDWAWGDAVLASIDGEEVSAHINAVQVQLAGGKETLQASLRVEESL